MCTAVRVHVLYDGLELSLFVIRSTHCTCTRVRVRVQYCISRKHPFLPFFCTRVQLYVYVYMYVYNARCKQHVYKTCSPTKVSQTHALPQPWLVTRRHRAPAAARPLLQRACPRVCSPHPRRLRTSTSTATFSATVARSRSSSTSPG